MGVVRLPRMTARPWAKARSAAKALGFFDGVSAFFGGLGFIVGRPAIWVWALIPTVIATILFVGLGALFIWTGTDFANRLLVADGALQTAGLWILRVVLGTVGLVLAF